MSFRMRRVLGLGRTVRHVMEVAYNKRNTSMKPELITYNTVLDTFSKEGDANSAERLLEKMFHRGDDMVKPNTPLYASVSFMNCLPQNVNSTFLHLSQLCFPFTQVLTPWLRSE